MYAARAVTLPTIAELVGQRVREIRKRAGRSQGELADAARGVDLDWTRASVAALETGRRGLSVEEFLLLPFALRALDGQAHSLAELLQGPKVTRTPRGDIPTSFLRTLLRGGDTASISRRARTGPRAPRDVIADEAAREAERHAAKVLGVPAERIVRAAHARFGRGLTEEREDRLRVLPWVSDRQAARGHITRALLEALRKDLERQEADDG